MVSKLLFSTAAKFSPVVVKSNFAPSIVIFFPWIVGNSAVIVNLPSPVITISLLDLIPKLVLVTIILLSPFKIILISSSVLTKLIP